MISKIQDEIINNKLLGNNKDKDGKDMLDTNGAYEYAQKIWHGGELFRDGFPILFQNGEQPWSHIVYQNSDDIPVNNLDNHIMHAGCNVMSMAMAMYPFNNIPHPYDAIEFVLGKHKANSRNYRAESDSGVCMDFFVDYATHLGINVQVVEGGHYTKSQANKEMVKSMLDNALENGGSAVLRLFPGHYMEYKGDGHYIVIVGKKEDRDGKTEYIVHDSNYPARKRMDETYEFDYLYGDAKNYFIFDKECKAPNIYVEWKD